jgi:two-component system, NarL family, response regulator LiaR
MEEQKPIRVLVADDHAVVRGGLGVFLRAFPDMELVGEASNGREAVQRCQELQPDVVLMDLKMPVVDGVAATQAIRQAMPNVRVIVLTSFTEDDLVPKALQAGAIGYLLKTVSHRELAKAIRSACAGRSTLAPEATQALIQATLQPPAPGADLTTRELEVLALMVQGLSNLQIADQLVIAESTAKTHVSSIIAKLGVSSRTQAVALALKYNLVG